MTSGTFRTVPISEIIVNREARQRRELPDISDLADSIARNGLIHPIVVAPDMTLVAGERRLTACKSLGWTDIPVQFTSDLSVEELRTIELEENIKRVDIPWQDQVRAVEELHKIKSKNPEWSADKTAALIGLSPRQTYKFLQVAKELGDKKVATADTFSIAQNIVTRKAERAAASAISAIRDTTTTPDLILVEDFTKWAPNYSGPKFNLIHCDFPYGVNMHKSAQGSHIEVLGGYHDTHDIYWNLVDTLIAHQSNFVADSAHMIFWFSMNYYTETIERLNAAGWTVIPHPLIWAKTDNAGILSDPARRPRHIYETALLAHRGDRKLVRAKSDFVGHPTTKEFHVSEKPEPVLTHFMEMLVDYTTTLLDPTAGSGTALRVARRLGAVNLLGLEINPDFAAQANARLK